MIKSSELDPNFKYEIAKEPGGENIKLCLTALDAPWAALSLR